MKSIEKRYTTKQKFAIWSYVALMVFLVISFGVYVGAVLLEEYPQANFMSLSLRGSKAEHQTVPVSSDTSFSEPDTSDSADEEPFYEDESVVIDGEGYETATASTQTAAVGRISRKKRNTGGSTTTTTATTTTTTTATTTTTPPAEEAPVETVPTEPAPVVESAPPTTVTAVSTPPTVAPTTTTQTQVTTTTTEVTPPAIVGTNVAPQGTAYRWSKNSTALLNSNRALETRLNDGNELVDVPLAGGLGETSALYEAGGIVWTSARTITSVQFVNGTWTSSADGVFTAKLSLQFTMDGTTWQDSGWTVIPTYDYDSSSVSGQIYTFTGTGVSVLGVRVSGQVHTSGMRSYWANLREVRAYSVTQTTGNTVATTTAPTSPAPAPAPTPTPTPAPAPAPLATPTSSTLNYTFGIAVGNILPWLSDAELAKRLDDMAAHGVGWIRMDFSWNDIQYNNASTYDWVLHDKVVNAATQRNIKVLPILLYTPSWARISGCLGDEYCAPQDPTLFAKFAREAAKRYAPKGIHAWEIWNEQNHGRYWGANGNIAGYTALLKVTSPAIKAEDPSAIIITGGFGPADTDGTNVSPTDFLKGMYSLGARTYFDAVGHHPYTYPVPPTYVEDWNAWLQMFQTTTNLRDIMIANGDGAKKIWLTEYGAPTGGPGTLAEPTNYRLSQNPDHVTEELQETILADALMLNKSYTWSGPLFWYSYKDLGTSNSSNENFFGLRRYDGTEKPAYARLKIILQSQ